MSRPDIEIVASHLLIYRGLGMTPIPLRGKIPLVKWGTYTYNAADFLKPNVNIGVKGGLLASNDYLYFVDIDAKELLADFYGEHPTLMSAPLVSTSRGWHVWLTSKRSVKTCTFPEGEIRAEEAYVCAPPSIHASGHHYKFIKPLVGMPPTYDARWIAPVAQDKPSTNVIDVSTWETE